MGSCKLLAIFFGIVEIDSERGVCHKRSTENFILDLKDPARRKMFFASFLVSRSVEEARESKKSVTNR